MARALREDGVPVEDHEMLTPVESAITYTAPGWWRPASPRLAAIEAGWCSSPTQGHRRPSSHRRQALPRGRRGDQHAAWLADRSDWVIGDDAGIDIALGRLGGSKTVLVRSGISGAIDLEKLPERHRPHAVIDGVSDLLQALAPP